MANKGSLFIVVLVVAGTFCIGPICRSEEPNKDGLKPADQAELDALVKQVEAKSDELAALQKKVDDLRAKTNATTPQKGIGQLQAILNKLPKEDQPKDGDDEEAMFARDRANKWLGENLVGETLSFSDKITDVSIKPMPTEGPGRYYGHITLGHGSKPEPNYGAEGPATVPIGTVRSGSMEWKVVYTIRKSLTQKDLDEAAAKKLLQLKGKTVTLTSGPVDSARFEVNRRGQRSSVRGAAGPRLIINMPDASIDELDSANN